MNFKKMVINFLPPALRACLNSCVVRGYKWIGDYKSWDEARKRTVGYDCELILEKTKEALLMVKNGKALFARDSVIFDKIEYSYPVLAGLMWVASLEGGRLNIMDFGGSLGSSYFQNKIFLSYLKEVRWNIIEQKHFVECGKKYFEKDEALKFYETINECLKEEAPSSVLLSGVIQYLEKPYEILDFLVQRKLKYIIIDRTTFNKKAQDKLVIQKVGPKIFNASYPCWFLNEEEFKRIFYLKYTLVNEFISFEDRGCMRYPAFKGFIYKLKE